MPLFFDLTRQLGMCCVGVQFTYIWICVVMRARDECSKLSAPRVYIIWYVCMYVCIYMCMFVRVYLYTCKRMSLCVHTCECVCTCWQYIHAYACEFMRRIDTICMFRTCDPVMRIRVWVSSCTWQLCECFDYFVFLQVYLIRRHENWNIPVGVRIYMFLRWPFLECTNMLPIQQCACIHVTCLSICTCMYVWWIYVYTHVYIRNAPRVV